MVRNNTGLGLSVNTVLSVKSVLSAAFNFGVANKLIEENPVSKTKLPPPPLSAVNPLTLEEAWTFSAAKDFFWYGNFHVFALQTGLRPEEEIALIWSDINLKEGVVRIERACKWINSSFTGFGKVKTRRSVRTIELTNEHVEFLKDHKEKLSAHAEQAKKVGRWVGEPAVLKWIKKFRSKQLDLYKETDLVFPSRLGKVPSSTILHASFKAMLRKAGFRDHRLQVRPYDLRHTHATLLLILGVPPHEVAARLGHTVTMLNNIYAHILEGRQRRASKLFVSLVPFNVGGNISRADIQRHLKELISTSNKDLEEALCQLLSV